MALSNKYILFGLPCFRNSNKLTFEIETEIGEKVQKNIEKNIDEKNFTSIVMRIMQHINSLIIV